MNDSLRIQGTDNKQFGSTSGGGPTGMDGCFLRPQESTSNETYYEGDIDCVHEI